MHVSKRVLVLFQMTAIEIPIITGGVTNRLMSPSQVRVSFETTINCWQRGSKVAIADMGLRLIMVFDKAIRRERKFLPVVCADSWGVLALLSQVGVLKPVIVRPWCYNLAPPKSGCSVWKSDD